MLKEIFIHPGADLLVPNGVYNLANTFNFKGRLCAQFHSATFVESWSRGIDLYRNPKKITRTKTDDNDAKGDISFHMGRNRNGLHLILRKKIEKLKKVVFCEKKQLGRWGLHQTRFAQGSMQLELRVKTTSNQSF